jgi:heptosyltransferase III
VVTNFQSRNGNVSGRRRAVARVLQAFSSFRRSRFDGKVRSIAIIMAGRYGDAILLTKLLRQLKAADPDISLHLLVSRKTNSGFFGACPYVADVFCLKSGVREWLKLLFFTRFDVLFNPLDSPSNSILILSTFLRARLKVSHNHVLHQGIFDRLIELDYYSHMTIHNEGLLDVLAMKVPPGSDIRPELPHYPVSGEVEQFAREISGRGYAGINVSAGNASRYWTREKWQELARMFPEEVFLVFSSKEDLEEKKILETSLGNVIASPVTANLAEVGAIVRQLRILVSPDTSLVHIAACFDTPVIALFLDNLRTMKRFAPLSSNSEIVISDSRQVSDIEAEAVAAAFRRVRERC